MDSLSIPEPGESEFFITTYLRLDKLYFVENPPQSNCPDGVDINLPDSAELLGNFFDVCLYNTFEQYFPIAPEEIPLVPSCQSFQKGMWFSLGNCSFILHFCGG